MFMFFCNKCFLPKNVENTNKYYFSNCGHVFCQSCTPTGLCHICKTPYAARTIDANMTKSMAVYFESPVNAFRRFQKIVQFQTMQDALNAHYYVNCLPQQIQAALKKLNGMKRIDAHLNEKLAHETTRIEKLKAYLAYKKRSLQERNQRHQRPARGRSATSTTYSSGRNSRPKTPTISTLSDVTMPSADCTKSTNLSNQSDSFLDHVRNDFTI
ncbi:RING finger protein nenya-like [Bactrocera neohumeralis]|uniref:RING finger protein nenya-like n=1 Tax=Bactrocera neohumeralis TaxID=98809 RepID=UPI002165A2C3|nr:RING finger protein nenya-like [Bactrocera neohumeralis]